MNELTGEIRIQRLVRQRCLSHPFQGTQTIFRHVISMKGGNVGSQITTILDNKYVDVTALLAGNEDELSELISQIYQVGKIIWNGN